MSIRRLRRRVWVLTALVATLMICQAICLGMLFLGIPQREEVRAKRFVLENSAGTICGEWGMIAGLYSAESGMIGDSMALRLGSEPGGAHILLGAYKTGTVLAMYGETGSPRILLRGFDKDTRFRLWDASDKIICELP